MNPTIRCATIGEHALHLQLVGSIVSCTCAGAGTLPLEPTTHTLGQGRLRPRLAIRAQERANHGR